MWKEKNVTPWNSVHCIKSAEWGCHVVVNGESKILAVDNVVICAGQLPLRDLLGGLEQARQDVFLIGGAKQALELDAKRAIDQGCRLAASF